MAKPTAKAKKTELPMVIPYDALKQMYLAWSGGRYTAFENLTLEQADRMAKAFIVARKYKLPAAPKSR